MAGGSIIPRHYWRTGTKRNPGPDLQYLKVYDWNGEELELQFGIDFFAEKLGAPHQMRFGPIPVW